MFANKIHFFTFTRHTKNCLPLNLIKSGILTQTDLNFEQYLFYVNAMGNYTVYFLSTLFIVHIISGKNSI